MQNTALTSNKQDANGLQRSPEQQLFHFFINSYKLSSSNNLTHSKIWQCIKIIYKEKLTFRTSYPKIYDVPTDQSSCV